MDFRSDIIDVTRRYYETRIEQHRINAEVILNHVIGTGNSDNVSQAFDYQVAQMAEFENKLQTLKRYFK
jgi:hypothetical protein